MTAGTAIAGERLSFGTTIRNYVTITKPRVIVLLLITTVPPMVVAQHGWPSTWLVLATLIGGTLSAAGANAINCWYDRDIDAVMRRTRTRPTVTGEIEAPRALTFGVVLGVGAFVFLWATTTLMAASLSLVALLFYVFVYTIWLKRRTPQNIVIGGAAGAFPPMVGWAAVTGDIALASCVMFAIIFFWTPPHFWALSLRLKDDYTEAGVPMLPVTDGVAVTRLQILGYTVLLVVVTLLLLPAGTLSWIYLGSATVLGAGFTWASFRLWQGRSSMQPITLYKLSMLYLALLFVSMGVDVAILG
jgi:protoheme IX farnesyltransferase